jgi:hypothetical protein
MMLSIHTKHGISVDVNTGQFSGYIHPLSSKGFLWVDTQSVVDEISFVNTNNDTMARGYPLQFTINFSPL